MSGFPGGQGAAVGGQVPTLTTVDLMRDKGTVNTLHEDFARGVGKAHRQVVFSNGEHRNYRRSGPMKRGVIGETE